MKRILFALLLCGIVGGMSSCRKENKNIDIKTYDEQQVQAYISANGLTGFARDQTGGDTSGIYYKIIKQGTGKTLDYADKLSLVFTIKSFDGKYQSVDTSLNHLYDYVGHITVDRWKVPAAGVQLAILNVLKNRGTSARVLIPSRLAYGKNGFGSGSSEASNRVAGNESLDMYINIINDEDTNATDPTTGKKVTGQDIYDDMVVANYITRNNLTGYTKTASGLWYKTLEAGNGNVITPNMRVDVQWTEYLLNGARTGNEYNNQTGTGYPIDLSIESRRGILEGIPLATPGAKMSLIMPSRLMYGNTNSLNVNVPPLSCIRFDFNLIGVTQ